jgi:hypothetical protein
MAQNSTAVPADETTVQRTNRKTSSLSMLISAMFFSFAAGAELVIGLDRRAQGRGEYLLSFAFAVGFLAAAIRWAILLLARTRKNLDSPQV